MGKNPSEFLNELPGVFKEPITSAADSYHVDTYPDSDLLLYSYPDPIKISWQKLVDKKNRQGNFI